MWWLSFILGVHFFDVLGGCCCSSSLVCLIFFGFLFVFVVGWFLLSRCWLRLDHVVLRSKDVRYFHMFGSDVVLSERTERECTYDAMRLQGDTPRVCDNYKSSDLMAPKLTLISEQLDQISLTAPML